MSPREPVFHGQDIGQPDTRSPVSPTPVRRVADSPTPGCLVSGKKLCDTRIRHIGVALLSHNSGRMENGPDGATNTNAGAYHAPFQPEIEGEVAAILPILDGLTDAERHDYLIGLLDDHRRQYEATRLNRVPLMRLARENGLSCHDIGVVLGITENAVRTAINRAQGDA
ncbi:hypothetical protein [Nocardia asiatica]|uniref:hypothetical protein n=1 Tax=Nocardia asiatica TaxID=209252 RepID=UPI0024549A6A|nr:hypothetical protein [Nocardia asiatica]